MLALAAPLGQTPAEVAQRVREAWAADRDRRAAEFRARAGPILAEFKANAAGFAAQRARSAADYALHSTSAALAQHLPGVGEMLGASADEVDAYVKAAEKAGSTAGEILGIIVFAYGALEAIGYFSLLRQVFWSAEDQAAWQMLHNQAQVREILLKYGFTRQEAITIAEPINEALDGLHRWHADRYGAVFAQLMDECPTYRDIGAFVLGGVVDMIAGTDIALIESCPDMAHAAAQVGIRDPYWEILDDMIVQMLLEGAGGPTAAEVIAGGRRWFDEPAAAPVGPRPAGGGAFPVVAIIGLLSALSR